MLKSPQTLDNCALPLHQKTPNGKSGINRQCPAHSRAVGLYGRLWQTELSHALFDDEWPRRAEDWDKTLKLAK